MNDEITNSDIVSDQLYQSASGELKMMAAAMKNVQRAQALLKLSDEISRYSSSNPAPSDRQEQIMKFMNAKDRAFEMSQSKEKGMEL